MASTGGRAGARTAGSESAAKTAGRRSVFAALFALAAFHAPEGRAAEVVVSIKPIHSLVAGVMGETGTPLLLLRGAASPHTYQMRPSEARAMSAADLVIWVGPALETFLERPIENLGARAAVLTLHEAPGIRLLPNREGGMRDHDDADDHGDEDEEHGHDHDDADDHADEDEEHGNDHGDADDHADEDEEHDHDHGVFDMHVWLDPGNTRRFVEAIAEALARVDPGHAPTYRSNAEALKQRIDALESSLRTRLAPVRGHAFIVFHDAYQYFELAFGLNGRGAIAVDPARPPGARRLAELRAALSEHDIRCVFSEPQFESDLVRTVVGETGIRIATLDPIGADIEPGPDAWFEVMRGLGEAIADCLGAP